MYGFILYIRYIKSERVTTEECRKNRHHFFKNYLTILIYLYNLYKLNSNFCFSAISTFIMLYSTFGPKLCFILLLDKDYAFSAFEFSKLKHIADLQITTIILNRRSGVYVCILLFLIYGRLTYYSFQRTVYSLQLYS